MRKARPRPGLGGSAPRGWVAPAPLAWRAVRATQSAWQRTPGGPTINTRRPPAPPGFAYRLSWKGGARSALRPQIALLQTLCPSGADQTSPRTPGERAGAEDRAADPEVLRDPEFPKAPGPCRRHWGGRWAKAAAQESEVSRVGKWRVSEDVFWVWNRPLL